MNVSFGGDLPHLPPWLCPLFVSLWVEKGMFLDDVSYVSLFLSLFSFFLSDDMSRLFSLCFSAFSLANALDTHKHTLSISLSLTHTQTHTHTQRSHTHTQMKKGQQERRARKNAGMRERTRTSNFPRHRCVCLSVCVCERERERKRERVRMCCLPQSCPPKPSP
jgi:hypothetical protein